MGSAQGSWERGERARRSLQTQEGAPGFGRGLEWRFPKPTPSSGVRPGQHAERARWRVCAGVLCLSLFVCLLVCLLLLWG